MGAHLKSRYWFGGSRIKTSLVVNYTCERVITYPNFVLPSRGCIIMFHRHSGRHEIPRKMLHLVCTPKIFYMVAPSVIVALNIL